MPKELTPVTVLLVEDDARQSDALKSLFEGSSPDTAVIVASTLQAALEHDRAALDAVLLDLALPDSSGLDTLTAALARFAPVPVIVLTGQADAETGERAIALGAEDYLEKVKVPPAAIRRVVRMAIRRYAERLAAIQREGQNRALAQLGQLALTNVSTATLLGTVCEVVAHVLGVTGAMFVERSVDGLLVARATAGCTAVSWPPVSADAESPLRDAIRTNRPVRIDDVRIEDERTSGGDAAAAIFGPLGAVSVLAVPVRTTFTAPEGVLVVWREELRAFTDQEVAFLGAVSNILAAAIQRNATQEALLATGQKIERILDAVPDRIFRFDHNRRVRYMNQAAAHGLPFIELGMHADEFFVPPAHRVRWRSGLERALVSRVAERFDMEGLAARRYDVSLVPLTHEGAPSIIVVLRDITERVRAQARYETLFASNVVGVFFCGSDGVVTEANRCFLELVGREPADVTGRRITIRSLMSPSAQAIHAARLREIRERGVLPPLPGELLHSNGSSVPVLLASAVVERAPDEIVTFLVDETATRRAENELRNQTLLLDGARDAIMLRDLDGRISFWNEGARRLYGWTRDEAVGRLLSELISMPADDTGAAADASVVACGEWQGELQQHTKAGAQIVVDSRCSLIESAYGEAPMILIINTDITERRALERQLRHAQRLESLGILGRGIAHDLNNILMSITISSEVLKRAAVPPKAEQAVDRITMSARRGADIIRQLLTLARGPGVEGETADPGRLVSEAEGMLRNAIPPSISIETALDPNIWSIACDPGHVLQVLLTLGMNAGQAMPGGGRLVIQAENVEVDAQSARMNPGASAGVYVMLSVSDTGTGIAPELETDTGIGLATVRSIVKNHGGFLNVSSEPGATVLKVYLPALLETPAENAGAAAPPVVSGNGQLILVIDPDRAILDVTAATLESFGYRVLTASDGSEGIALYAQTPDVAVVVTDMRMPVLEALREINPNVRVLGMSSDVSPAMTEPMPDVLLRKPFRAADLLNAIHSVLARGES